MLRASTPRARHLKKLFSPEEQLALGHHVSSQYKSALIYSRDNQIGLCSKIHIMLEKIRQETFQPDNSRVQRLLQPLEKIIRDNREVPTGKAFCWEATNQCAYFANPDRLDGLLKHMKAEWFYPGEKEEEGRIRYGICSDYLSDVIEGFFCWMLPRAGPSVEHVSHWRKYLLFHGFEMIAQEIKQLVRAAVILPLFRWQWITCWIEVNKSVRDDAQDAL